MKAYLDHLPPTSYLSHPQTWRMYRVSNSTAVCALTCFLQVSLLLKISGQKTVLFVSHFAITDSFCFHFFLFSPSPHYFISLLEWRRQTCVWGMYLVPSYLPHILATAVRVAWPSPTLSWLELPSSNTRVLSFPCESSLNTGLFYCSFTEGLNSGIWAAPKRIPMDCLRRWACCAFAGHREETVGKRPTSSFLTLKELLFPWGKFGTVQRKFLAAMPCLVTTGRVAYVPRGKIFF